MGIRVLCDEDQDQAVLYNSVTMTAFGPVMGGTGTADAREIAEAVITHCRNLVSGGTHAIQKLSHEELVDAYIAVREARVAAAKAEEEPTATPTIKEANLLHSLALFDQDRKRQTGEE